MDEFLAALADPARWRLVGLLAERPRSVGVLAQQAGARQPQTTKHLQTLERAGIVTSQRSGQRRIYALQSAPLRELSAELGRLAETADRAGGSGETFRRYRNNQDDGRRAADRAGWADGRGFRFHRTLPGPAGDVWRRLTEPELLAQWWAPADLRVSELVFQAEPGGQIVLEYRDVEDVEDTDPVAGRAEGQVDDVRPGEHLGYRLAPLLPDGSPAFTSHVELDLSPTGNEFETELAVTWRITGSTADSADFVAGIEIGFGQSLDTLAAILAADSNGTTSSTQ